MITVILSILGEIVVGLDFSHSDNVDKVVLSKSVQDGVDGVFGNGHLQPLHAAADVHHDDDVLRRCGCLDVPAQKTTEETSSFYSSLNYNSYKQLP